MSSLDQILKKEHRIVFLGIILILFAYPAGSSKKIRSPSNTELSTGAWIGFAQEWDLLVRLRLEPSGSGKCAWVGGGGKIFRFEIAEWRRHPAGVRLVLSDTSEIRKADLDFVGGSLELRVWGAGWRRRVLLDPESVLESRWRLLKESMARAHHD